MASLPHLIGTQTLEVEIATEAAAVALIDRVADLNRDSLLPVIERVLDEFDQPDVTLSIARLALELGTIPADRLALAAERLESRLREALRRALDARTPARRRDAADAGHA